ncbi:MAG: zf-TFIIB domain-containing protein [Thermomicrobiales bacterium]
MQTTIYCPKCSGDMVPVRRSGVLIDRCSDCNGVYLDRGELEKIIAMEQQASDRWEDEPNTTTRIAARSRRRKSRKRSFFEDLFDIDSGIGAGAARRQIISRLGRALSRGKFTSIDGHSSACSSDEWHSSPARIADIRRSSMDFGDLFDIR